MRGLWLVGIIGIVKAQCPYLSGNMVIGNNDLHRRQAMDATGSTFVQTADDPADTITETLQPILETIYLNDTASYMTTDFGTPIQDQTSLKVGSRGPTLLEDFMFRQKLQRFDHERVSYICRTQYMVHIWDLLLIDFVTDS
jgi:catalase